MPSRPQVLRSPDHTRATTRWFPRGLGAAVTALPVGLYNNRGGGTGRVSKASGGSQASNSDDDGRALFGRETLQVSEHHESPSRNAYDIS